MKISRKIMITLFICFFVSWFVFTIVSSKELKVDITNAIQTIQSIVLYSWNNEWNLTVKDRKLILSWKNFTISSGNYIEHTEYSNILWWDKNTIERWKNSVILAWESNSINSNNSFIGWWIENKVFDNSASSLIIGGENNVVDGSYNKAENSLIIWNSNNVWGSYSSVIWNNNKIENANYSVAMWSGAKVKWNNSFLWTDGGEEVTLNESGVFVIISEQGMAVGNPTIDDLAKLNIWGSFIVSTWVNDENIQCGTGNGVWIIKLVDRTDILEQKCLCNCDGEKWNSMMWDWQCESICNWDRADFTPECPIWKWITIVESGDKKLFSWECVWWTVIDESYFYKWDTVYRVCQSKNGNTTTCKYTSKCIWNVPWSGVSAQKNNNIVPRIEWPEIQYSYSEDKSAVCTYSCKDGYALKENNVDCGKVCNEGDRNCNLWTYIPWPLTLTTDYKYKCDYREKTYTCNVDCNDGYIWNWNTCINKSQVCGSEKYKCLYWTVSDTWTDLKNFVWNCKNEWGSIIYSCSKAKDKVNKTVYYNKNLNNIENRWYVYFHVTGTDISKDINIKQEYDYRQNLWFVSFRIFTIPARNTSSVIDNFVWSMSLWWPTWWVNNGCEVGSEWELYMPIEDKLYVLTIQEDKNNLCAASCSTAWQCINGGSLVPNSLRKTLSGNKATFKWSCRKSTTQVCETSCEVDVWQCTIMPWDWSAESCDPSSNPNCNILWWWSVNLDNFYMDIKEDRIVSSKCGDKRHCILSWGYIRCTESRENCVQSWFKCKDGYILSGCSCKLTSDMCDTSQNPWKCKVWQVISYSSATWTMDYKYRCQKGTQQVLCDGKCNTGTVWNWSACVSTWLDLCGETHYNCKNTAVLNSSQEVESLHKYIWTCRLWDSNITNSCMECYSWYIKTGDVCQKIPPVDCESTGIDGYTIPYLHNKESYTATKYTRDSVCTLPVLCQSWTTKPVYSENCKKVCNTWTNLWTCITGFSVTWYNGNFGESGYTYKCTDNSGYVFIDKCYAKCPTGQYWSGNACQIINISVCSGTHYNCINNAKVDYSHSTSTGNAYYTVTTYEWFCHVWNMPSQRCVETVTGANWCKKGEYSGYNISIDMSHWQQLSVNKTTSDNKKCTATAICGSGRVTITGEDCTNACPGGVLDKPKCNFAGVNPTSLQSATWISSYTYKCGNSQCMADCSTGKIWNWSECVNRISPCDNINAACKQWNKKSVQNGTWWSTWNCTDVSGVNLNETICYKCNDGYVRNSTKNKCEEKSCSATTKNGYNIPALSWWSTTWVSKSINSWSCTAVATCSKWMVSLSGNSCQCINTCYRDGSACRVICGDGVTTKCNWPYSSTWFSWQYAAGLWWNLRWSWYTCTKNVNSSVVWPSSIKCNCPVGSIWNGSLCSPYDNDLCKNDTKYGCNNSYPTNKQEINGGYIWTCMNAETTEGFCHYCNNGYEWNGNTCVKQCHNCAKNGFPYCFPIDFSSTCKESDYIL